MGRGEEGREEGRGGEGREEGRGGEERGGEGRGLLVNMMEKKETFTHLVFTYLVLLCMYDDRLAGMHTYVCIYMHKVHLSHFLCLQTTLGNLPTICYLMVYYHIRTYNRCADIEQHSMYLHVRM